MSIDSVINVNLFSINPNNKKRRKVRNHSLILSIHIGDKDFKNDEDIDLSDCRSR